jgi:hypothetical protein
MVCPHHQVGAGKLLVVLFLRQPYTDDRGSVSIEFRTSLRFTGFVCNIPNSDNSAGLYQWLLP